MKAVLEYNFEFDVCELGMIFFFFGGRGRQGSFWANLCLYVCVYFISQFEYINISTKTDFFFF